MNTPLPRLDSFPASGGDLVGTELIARLANEIFSEAHRSGLQPVSPSAASAAGAHDAGLGGAYPAVTNPIAPPVHPGVTSAVGKPTHSNETASGQHAPESSDAYAFGEPRCYQGIAGNPARRERDNPQPVLEAPAPGFSLSDAGSAGEFYFLRSQGTQGALTLPGTSNLATASPVPWFDVQRVRQDFPALHQSVNGKPLIWLDNAATTHKPQSVIDATSQFYRRDNSNIHRAAHSLAARATELYEGGRDKVRQFIGAADAREIVFVRGTTEAINLIAQTFGKKFVGAGDEILLTTMEHHANIVPWQLLAEQTGAVLRVAPINDRGELILEHFATLLGPRTKLVSVTHVANALGTVNPVEQIIAIAHAYGVPVLVDGAQSAPHLPINVQALGADFFAFSGHKVFGPTGIGVLYGQSKWLEQLPPYQGGGNMIQEVTFAKTTYQSYPQRFEAGTQDIAGVVGLGAAVDYLSSLGLPAIAAYEHELLAYATDALSSVPGLRPIGTAANKASVLSFIIDGIPADQVGKHLDQHGIAVRYGHHCAQPALRRFGLESTVRPSLAFYNTHEEIDELVRVLHRLPKKA
jgi:cysteine desulfurase / selenocysteine lyase